MSAGARAWRNRAASLGLAFATVLAARSLAPEPEQRAVLLYTVVVLLGYGHLLGAAWFAAARSPRRSAIGAFRQSVWIGAAFASYLAVLESFPLAVLPLLAISTWHTVENDLVLGATCARPRGAAPLPRTAAFHCLVLGGTALLLAFFAGAGAGPALASATASGALAQATAATWRGAAAAFALALAVLAPSRRASAAILAAAAALFPDRPASGLGFPEAFALFGLYHLISWLGILAERGHGRRLLAVHAPPAALCGALLVLPGGGAEAARALVFSPAVYLFWSVLHVGQTALERARREPARGAAGGAP